MMNLSYSIHGADKVGTQAVGKACEILLKKGFYDFDLVDEVYNGLRSKKARARAVIARSMFNYVTQALQRYRANIFVFH